jgi:transposase InsO family protein
MPWQEVSTVRLREEFVLLASREGANKEALCRRFGISHKTGYKWLQRYASGGLEGLQDRSRRPGSSPARTSSDIEQRVLQARDLHPAWGGRMIRAWLQARGEPSPSASTITAILRRQGRTDPGEARKHQPWQRFEHAAPNQLWQMDFKGDFLVGNRRCFPLTVLDDHSRYSVVLQACTDQQGSTVRSILETTFRRYGLPDRMVMDNGSPWGRTDASVYSQLTVWLMQLPVAVSHGRPYHPQTQGKDERFHRTLNVEVLQGRCFRDFASCQATFDDWRLMYNFERPHQALGLRTPSSRFVSSSRPFPERLVPFQYDSTDEVRKVQGKGEVWLKGKPYRVSAAFHGQYVALRPQPTDGLWHVFFGTHRVAQIVESQPAW